MSNVITFTDTFSVIPEEYNPVPASRLIPDWYKNMDSYVFGEKKPTGDGSTTGTIKRCMPVFDAMNAGYILVTHCDLWVSKTTDDNGKTVPWYEWSNFGALNFHPDFQASQHPQANGNPIPKWMNPWSIKTPKGYSTLFVSPFHHDLSINTMPGVVDTDNYFAPVNIIFTIKDPDFEGLIPAGTPIVQAIPFKRESWEMQFGNQKDILEQQKVTTKLMTKFFDKYKTMFRESKEYK